MKDLVTVFTPVYNRKNLIGNLYQRFVVSNLLKILNGLLLTMGALMILMKL